MREASVQFHHDSVPASRQYRLCNRNSRRSGTLIDHVKAYNAQASGNIAIKHYYRPIPLSELESVTNRSSEAVQQDANGVLQYTSTSEGMWQNPGY